MKPTIAVALVCSFVLGCRPSKTETATPRTHAIMTLTSTAFEDGQPMPRSSSGEGGDISPDLAWQGVPEGTRSFALVCRDPDAPAGAFVHWVLYNIPDSVRALGSSLGIDRQLPAGAVHGRNSNGLAGYSGPMPPPGKPHRYVFTLYALDTVLPAAPDLSARELEQKMRGHVLGTGRLTGTYQRK